MKKLSRLVELRALSDENFKKELESVGLRCGLALNYGVSYDVVDREVRRRKDSQTLLKYNIESEFEIHSKDAWKGSKERYSFVEAGLMGNVPIINK